MGICVWSSLEVRLAMYTLATAVVADRYIPAAAATGAGSTTFAVPFATASAGAATTARRFLVLVVALDRRRSIARPVHTQTRTQTQTKTLQIEHQTIGHRNARPAFVGLLTLLVGFRIAAGVIRTDLEQFVDFLMI